MKPKRQIGPKLLATAILGLGLGASGILVAQESQSSKPADSAADTEKHGMMGKMMGDPEMKAQMMRMMENCNRMMEKSVQEESSTKS